MRRLLPALALALGLTSCSWLDRVMTDIDDIDIPLEYSSDIAGQLQVILVRSDLDMDGHIQGWNELLELCRQLYQAVVELREEHGEDPGDS